MKFKIFDYRFILIPLSIPLLHDVNARGEITIEYRVLYVFGIRLAYWTVKE
jgi:hypothetical protein